MITLYFRFIFSQAIKFVHSCGYVHMDIRPKNILIDTKTKQLWLINFNLAVTIEKLEADREDDWGGTPMYMAPEVLQGFRWDISKKIDLWSIGVVLVEWVSKENTK